MTEHIWHALYTAVLFMMDAHYIRINTEGQKKIFNLKAKIMHRTPAYPG